MHNGSTMRSIGFGGLLLALLLVQASAGSYTPYSQLATPPTVAQLNADSCSLNGPGALPFPSNALCLSTGLTTQGVDGSSCQLLAIAEQMVLSMASPVASCTAAFQTPVSTTSSNGKQLRSQALRMLCMANLYVANMQPWLYEEAVVPLQCSLGYATAALYI